MRTHCVRTCHAQAHANMHAALMVPFRAPAARYDLCGSAHGGLECWKRDMNTHKPCTASSQKVSHRSPLTTRARGRHQKAHCRYSVQAAPGQDNAHFLIPFRCLHKARCFCHALASLHAIVDLFIVYVLFQQGHHWCNEVFHNSHTQNETSFGRARLMHSADSRPHTHVQRRAAIGSRRQMFVAHSGVEHRALRSRSPMHGVHNRSAILAYLYA